MGTVSQSNRSYDGSVASSVRVWYSTYLPVSSRSVLLTFLPVSLPLLRVITTFLLSSGSTEQHHSLSNQAVRWRSINTCPLHHFTLFQMVLACSAIYKSSDPTETIYRRPLSGKKRSYYRGTFHNFSVPVNMCDDDSVMDTIKYFEGDDVQVD